MPNIFWPNRSCFATPLCGRLAICVASLFLMSLPTTAMDIVKFNDGDQERTVTGRVLIEENGGVMVQADDGRIWTVLPEHMIERSSNDTEFQPVDADEMERRMLEELPGEFKVYRTSHYLVFYNSTESYAKVVSGLFEQLYRGFFTFWKNQRWDLPEPEFPLVALVLKDRSAFQSYAGDEIGDTANGIIGYYHLGTNRMTTYRVRDLERNVATIIHEATHQLAYNCGMQKRFADNPMWVSEGLAMFFESPDRRNPSRWRSIGQVNQTNLRRFHAYFPKRPEESLATLLADDTRLRNPSLMQESYGESWALTYFLIKTKKKEYVKFLQLLSEGQPLAEKSKRQRVEMFEKAFGSTLVDLDESFIKYMRRVR